MNMAPSSIDVHAHFLPPAFLEEIARDPTSYGLEVEGWGEGEVTVRRTDSGESFVVGENLFDVEARLTWIAAMGLGAQVLAPPTSVFFYDLPKEAACAVARLFNETMRDVCRSSPKLIPAATVPMGWPKDASREIDHAVNEMRIPMLFIGTNVAGEDLDGARFDPVYKKAAELGVPIQLHPPWPSKEERLERHYFWNLLGNPFETAVAAASLIAGGVLDRYPELTFLLGHGGGVFPYLSGRMDHGHRKMQAARFNGRSPRDYFDRFIFDTIVHDATALRYLIETVGPERIAIGTDSPYAMGDEGPLDTLRAVGLDQHDGVLVQNAARVLQGLIR